LLLDLSDGASWSFVFPTEEAPLAPLCSWLVPSTAARSKLLDAVVRITEQKSRAIPTFVLDKAQSWDATRDAKKRKKAATPPLLDQISQQLAPHMVANLRGPVGEYSWIAQFAGLADQGAQGFPGVFRQSFSLLSQQLQGSAGQGEDSMFVISPNGANEMGSDRNKFIINASLISSKDLKRFQTLGVIFGCALRSNTSLSVDLSSSVWKLLRYSPEGLCLLGDDVLQKEVATFDFAAAKAAQSVSSLWLHFF